MTRQLAVDYGKENIRANAIIVGFVNTGTPVMKAILEDPVRRAAFERNIMVPRFGEPADIAQLLPIDEERAAGAALVESSQAGTVVDGYL